MLPTSRNTNYAPTDPVLSADLDDIQDCIVAYKAPAHWRWQPFARAGRETNIAFDSSGGLWNGVIRATAGAAIYDGGLVCSVPVGFTVSGLAAKISGTGGVQNVQIGLWLNGTAIGNLVVANPPNGFNIYTLDPIALPSVLANGDILTVSASLPIAGTEVLGFGIKVSKL